MQLKKIIPALFLFAASTFAQVSYSTITGTVTDPNGNPLANAGLTASLVNAQGYAVSSTVTPNGQPFNGSPAYGTLDATGHFSINLAPNGILSKPSGTQWKITITSPADFAILTYAPPWTINYQFTVAGNADISTPLSALANPVAFFNTKTGQSTLRSSGGTPAAPAFCVNFANSTVTNFQCDPNITINPTSHTFIAPALSVGPTFSTVTTGTISAAEALLPSGGTLVVNSILTVPSNHATPANIHFSIQNGGGFNLSPGVVLSLNSPFAAGQYQIFYGSGTVSFASNPTLSEIYPQWWDQTVPGASSANDTAAWQAALTAASNIGGFGGTVSCPNTTYSINNTLTSFSSDTAHGISLKGPDSQINNANGACSLDWTGVVGGTMFHYLGGHLGKIQNVNFNANARAGQELWIDTAQQSSASTTISAITRSSNVVTATLAAAETWPSGTNVQLAGVTDPSYNGIFAVWYQTDSTHISWSQTGADGSSSGGTIQTAVGGDVSGLKIQRSSFYTAVQSGVSISTQTISGNVLSVTLSSPQLVYPNEWIWETGSSDPVYNAYWQVQTVTSPTTFTAQSFEVTSEAPSTSGTFYASTAGLVIGSKALSGINNSVCCMNVEEDVFEGPYASGANPWTLFGTEIIARSNTKDFTFKGNSFGPLRMAIMGGGAGIFQSEGDGGQAIIDCIWCLTNPGVARINGGGNDWEPLDGGEYDHPYVFANIQSGSFNASTLGPNGQFELNAGIGNNATVELSNLDLEEGQYATDGVAVSTSATLRIINSIFGEEYSTTPVPIINVSTYPNATTGRSSVYSEGNTYTNVAPLGYAPIYTAGEPVFGPTAPAGVINATSIFDKTAFGTVGNLEAYPLQSIISANLLNAQTVQVTQNGSIGNNLSVGGCLSSALFGTCPSRNNVLDSLFALGTADWPNGASPPLATITTNVGNDPFGGTTAEEVSFTPSLTNYAQSQTTGLTMLAGHTYQFSIFAYESVPGDYLAIELSNAHAECQTNGGTFPPKFVLTASLTEYSGTCTPLTNYTATPSIVFIPFANTTFNAFISQPQVCEVGVNCGPLLITTNAPVFSPGLTFYGRPIILAGNGVAIPTGPASSTNGDVATYDGTAGQMQDSGKAFAGSGAAVPTGPNSGTLLDDAACYIDTVGTMGDCNALSVVTLPPVNISGASKIQFTTIYSAAGTPLPTCNSGLSGTSASVSDATSPTYNGTYTSGGAVGVPVYCDGTNWTTH